MSKSNEIFEFEGQKYIKSKRASSEVKVSDVVRIYEDTPAASSWSCTSKRFLGTVQKVITVHENLRVKFVCIPGLWLNTDFEILEPAPKTNPRPHAELIKQWADDDSLEIEFREDICQPWEDTYQPAWIQGHQYRIKPKTVPAWQVLYELDGDFDLTAGHYKTEEEFNSKMRCGEKFIRFILETEKQVVA